MQRQPGGISGSIDPSHFHGVVGAVRPVVTAPLDAPADPDALLLRPLAEYEQIAGGGW